MIIAMNGANVVPTHSGRHGAELAIREEVPTGSGG